MSEKNNSRIKEFRQIRKEVCPLFRINIHSIYKN